MVGGWGPGGGGGGGGRRRSVEVSHHYNNPTPIAHQTVHGNLSSAHAALDLSHHCVNPKHIDACHCHGSPHSAVVAQLKCSVHRGEIATNRLASPPLSDGGLQHAKKMGG